MNEYVWGYDVENFIILPECVVCCVTPSSSSFFLFREGEKISTNTQKNPITVVYHQNNKNEYKHTVLLHVHGGGPVVISLQQRLRYMTQIAKSIFQRKSH